MAPSVVLFGGDSRLLALLVVLGTLTSCQGIATWLSVGNGEGENAERVTMAGGATSTTGISSGAAGPDTCGSFFVLRGWPLPLRGIDAVVSDGTFFRITLGRALLGRGFGETESSTVAG